MVICDGSSTAFASSIFSWTIDFTDVLSLSELLVKTDCSDVVCKELSIKGSLLSCVLSSADTFVSKLDSDFCSRSAIRLLFSVSSSAFLLYEPAMKD